MNIEPKEISIEDLKDSYREGFAFFKSNFKILLLMWLPLFLLMYIISEVKILIVFLPIVAAITYYATFEMVCTLFVDYKGGLLDKLKISFSAAVRVAKVFFYLEIVWVFLYIIMIYTPALNGFLTREDISKTVTMLWLSFWSILFVAHCFDPFACLKQGCVSMFLGDSKDYQIITAIYRKALSLNIKIVFRSLFIALCTTFLLMFFPVLFPFVAIFCACVSFFIFCKIFEPPQIKKQEKVVVENISAIPDLN